jgi:hypothetical protein
LPFSVDGSGDVEKSLAFGREPEPITVRQFAAFTCTP